MPWSTSSQKTSHVLASHTSHKDTKFREKLSFAFGAGTLCIIFTLTKPSLLPTTTSHVSPVTTVTSAPLMHLGCHDTSILIQTHQSQGINFMEKVLIKGQSIYALHLQLSCLTSHFNPVKAVTGTTLGRARPLTKYPAHLNPVTTVIPDGYCNITVKTVLRLQWCTSDCCDWAKIWGVCGQKAWLEEC